MSSNAIRDPRSTVTRSALTMIWIDAREATIIRWTDGAAALQRIVSDVPAHHRSTGHVRHEPGVRHGGGGRPQTAGEPRRLEHLDRFIGTVADAVGPDDVLIIGPGTVHEHLARHLAERDREHDLERVITTEAAAPMTERQLVARFRWAIGEEPRRRTVGAYRWTSPAAGAASTTGVVEGRRVAAKRRIDGAVRGDA